MRYGPSQLGCSFPYRASITTSFKTRAPSCISLGLTLELYLLSALCMETNSQTWVNSLNSSIRSVAHFKPISLASSLIWFHLHEGVLSSIGSMDSAP